MIPVPVWLFMSRSYRGSFNAESFSGRRVSCVNARIYRGNVAEMMEDEREMHQVHERLLIKSGSGEDKMDLW